MSGFLRQEKSSFNPAGDMHSEYRRALAQFPTGVTIVTCMSDVGPLGITVNSFTSVSMDPALIMWCPTKASRRYDAFMKAEYFAVHVMPVELRDLMLSILKS